MASFKVRRCLRLDHTFKVASNIGYLRSDGKWVTLYETIFIVLNEEGVVVSWQFTKSTSLEEVKPLFVALKERIELPERTPLTIYVDNCCHVRKQLQEIFGNDVCWLNLTYFTPYSESQGQCLSTTLYSCPVFMTLK